MHKDTLTPGLCLLVVENQYQNIVIVSVGDTQQSLLGQAAIMAVYGFSIFLGVFPMACFVLIAIILFTFKLVQRMQMPCQMRAISQIMILCVRAKKHSVYLILGVSDNSGLFSDACTPLIIIQSLQYNLPGFPMAPQDLLISILEIWFSRFFGNLSSYDLKLMENKVIAYLVSQLWNQEVLVQPLTTDQLK